MISYFRHAIDKVCIFSNAIGINCLFGLNGLWSLTNIREVNQESINLDEIERYEKSIWVSVCCCCDE